MTTPLFRLWPAIVILTTLASFFACSSGDDGGERDPQDPASPGGASGSDGGATGSGGMAPNSSRPPDGTAGAAMGGGGPSGPDTWRDSALIGRADKGPFQRGSVLKLHELDELGQRIEGRSIRGQVDAEGYFLTASLPFAGFVEVAVGGSYFNELDARLSEDRLELSVFGFAENSQMYAFINLFTTFTVARTRQLLAQQESSSIAEAIDTANRELAQIFYLNTDPSTYSLILNTTGAADEYQDRMVLLWFSVGFLGAKFGQSQYDVMVDDFADDGRINGQGRPLLEKVRVEATEERYEFGKRTLEKFYGDAPPAIAQGQWWTLSWRYGYDCEPSESNPARLCLGLNENLYSAEGSPDNPGQRQVTYPFVAPEPGGYFLVASYRNFASFQRWSLYDSEGQSKGGSNSNSGSGATQPLVAGESYTLEGNFFTEEDDDITSLRILKASDGTQDQPMPLAYKVAHQGAATINPTSPVMPDKSFYTFRTSKAWGSTESLSEQKRLRISVTDFDGDEPLEISVWGAPGLGPSSTTFYNESLLLTRETLDEAGSAYVVVTSDTTLHILIQNRSSDLTQLARQTYSVVVTSDG